MPVTVLHTPTATSFVRPAKHNIAIVDLSGSMSWATRDLARDMCQRIDNLPDKDYFSLAYFSSQGDYRWLVKGTAISNDSRRSLKEIVEKNFHSRNMTCFSEVLASTPQVIIDTAPFSNVVSLAFLSDGHPVVSNYQKELDAIFTAITQIKGMLSDAVIVGYGDYYNRELLLQMSQALGATFSHAQNIVEFGAEMEKTSKRKSAKRIKVKVPKNAKVVFSFDGGQVTVFEPDKDEHVEASEADKICVISDQKGSSDEDSLYAGALALLQTGKLDKALEIIGELGDVAIANLLGSAITNEELGKVEAMLKEALLDPAKRFTQGKQIGCVPKEDAFDILDLMSLLMQDDKAKFYPFHPEWHYKRIGRKSKTKDGYPEFQPDKDSAVNFSRLVWNESRLNLSVGLQISGKVELNGEPEKVNLPKIYPAKIFRTYALVANGFPNVKIIPASVSQETFDKLKSAGMISAGNWTENGIVLIDLGKATVCNRMKAKGKKSAETLGEKAVAALRLAAQLKVYKQIRKDLDPDKEFSKDLILTEPQRELLLANGIKDGIYSPPTESQKPTDVIPMREFDIKLKGFSSLPSVSAVREQMNKNKLNAAGALMAVALQTYEKDCPKTKGKALDWLSEKLADLDKQHKSLQTEIQAVKFALLLGNQWFDDLKRNEPSLKVKVDNSDYDVSFMTRTVDEEI